MKAKALVILTVVLCVAADKPKDDAKKELEKLQGTWVMAELEVNGELVPEKKLKGTILVIRGDKYIVKVNDQTHETTITLDPWRDQHRVHLLVA